MEKQRQIDMRILGSEKYIKENLNIKPITKGVLKSYSYIKTPKKLLKTGYIAKGEWRNLKNELEDTLFYIYLEYADIEKYKDVIGFSMFSDEVENAKDGVLVRLKGDFPNIGLSYRYISDMDDNLVYSKFSIVEILKDKNQPSDMDFDYFKRITFDQKLPQTTLIWKSKN